MSVQRIGSVCYKPTAHFTRRNIMKRLITLATATLALGAVPALPAEYLEPTNAQRSYGAGVVTEGGRIVWLAGMGGSRRADGTVITDFAEQTRQAFRNIETVLR